MAIADLIIRLKDEASAGLRGVRSALSDFGSSATDAAGQTQGLVGTIAQGVLQANAIQFAISKATEAVNFLNSKFEEAKSLQLANVSAATTFSSLTGQSYDQAAEFVDKLNARLAKSAAALPGATQDYKNLAIAIQDNVLEAFKDPSGKLNQKGFEDTLASIAESYGALSAASGVATGNTNLGLTKALAGASTDQLKQIQFFEQNQVVLTEIDKRLAALGKKSLKDLNISDRVKVIEQAGKKFITDDFKKRASSTADALIESYKSQMFDPTTGLFGLMRDLDPTTKGAQSAFTAFNDSLKLLIGDDGLLNKFGDIMKSLGLSVDPMAVLRNGILAFNKFLTQVNAQVDAISTFIKVSGEALNAGTVSVTDLAYTITQNVGNFSTNVISMVGAAIEKATDNVINQVNSQLAHVPSILSGIMSAIAPVISQGIHDLTARFLDLPVGGKLTAVAIGAAGAFYFFNTAIGQTALTLGGLLLSAIPVAIEAIAAVGLAVTGLGDATVGATVGLLRFVSFGLRPLVVTSWSSIVGGIGSLLTAVTSLSIGSIWSALTTELALMGGELLTFSGMVTTAGIALLANPIVLGIGAIALAAGLIYKYWEPITHFFAGFTSGVMEALSPLMPALNATANAIGTVFSPLVDLFKAAWGWLTELFTPIKDTDNAATNLGKTFGEIVGGGIMVAVNAMTTLLDWLGQGIEKLNSFLGIVGQAAPGLSSFASALASQLPQQAPAPSTPTIAGAKFAGHIVGNAANGFMGDLLSAAQSEMAAMPVGAQLLVANTSESIVPRGGLGQVAANAISNATPTMTRGGNTINLALTINAGAGDANAIAQVAVSAIQQLFESELSSHLG